jgi:hypothetical protein
MSKRPPASRAVTEANRLFKPAQPETTETEYAKTQKAFDDNRERLKAERLAREASDESARKRKPSS